MRLLRILGLTLAALLVLAAGAVATLWFAAAGAVETEVRAWAAEPHAGFSVTVGAVAVSGFPTQLVATIDNLSLSSEALALRYDTGRILVTRDLRSGVTSFSLPTPQTVTLESGTAFTLAADRFVGTLRQRTDGSFGGFNLDAAGVAIELPGSPIARAQRVVFQIALPKADGLLPSGTRAALRLDQMVVPSQRRGPFGDTIQQVVANFEIDGTIASLALAPSLVAWQPNGRLYLSDAVLRWGTLEASPMGGNLRLDRTLRPAGWLDMLFHDPRPAFEAMAAADWIDRAVRVELINGTPYDPNRPLLKQYRVTFLDGKVVLDDIEMDHTAPITLWTVPSVLARRILSPGAR